VETARVVMSLEQRMREAEATFFKKFKLAADCPYVQVMNCAGQAHQQRVQASRQQNWGPSPWVPLT